MQIENNVIPLVPRTRKANSIGGNPATQQQLVLCPYVGLSHDNTTALAFPSIGNYCHHAEPITALHLDYQAQYCLRSAHQGCQIYLSKEKVTMAHSGRRLVRRRSFWAKLLRR